MDLLKRLLNNPNKKPTGATSSSNVKTDIYSVPPTCRRLYQRARPLK